MSISTTFPPGVLLRSFCPLLGIMRVLNAASRERECSAIRCPVLSKGLSSDLHTAALMYSIRAVSHHDNISLLFQAQKDGEVSSVKRAMPQFMKRLSYKMKDQRPSTGARHFSTEIEAFDSNLYHRV